MTPLLRASAAQTSLLRLADGRRLQATHAESSEYPHPNHPHRHRSGGVVVYVATLTDLRDWSIWMDKPIDDAAPDCSNHVHHYVHGEHDGVSVTVVTLVPVEAEAVAS